MDILTSWSAVYPAFHLARTGIIVVVVQYRLGMFGFMSTFDESTNSNFGGNYGLMDQHMAIKFVKNNAENIGGDPKNINLVGTSAGGQVRVRNPFLFKKFAQKKFKIMIKYRNFRRLPRFNILIGNMGI